MYLYYFGILGFLIIYANGYLIKRRKKELGIYFTLGMEKGKVSRLYIENVYYRFVFTYYRTGAWNIYFPRASVVTARMFEVDMRSFNFLFTKCIF
jgi:putative ABC transport system permease protein